MGEVVELEALGELVGLEEQDHQALTVTVLGMVQVVVEMEVVREDKEEMEMEGELVMEVEVVVEELVELVVWAVLVALDGLVQSQTVYGTVQEGVMGKKGKQRKKKQFGNGRKGKAQALRGSTENSLSSFKVDVHSNTDNGKSTVNLGAVRGDIN